MAIQKLPPQSVLSKEEETLKKAIVAEIKRPETQRPAKGTPVVLSEYGAFDGAMHYYVVWDRFENFDGESRFRIVYYAIEKALGLEEANKASLFLGFTRSEAKERIPNIGSF